MNNTKLYWLMRTGLDGTTFWTNNVEGCYWLIVFEKGGLYAIYDYRGNESPFGSRLLYSKSFKQCKIIIRKFYNQSNHQRECENAQL